MSLPALVEKVSATITADGRKDGVFRIFCKALYFYLSLKIVFSWPAWTLLVKYHRFHQSHSSVKAILFFPAYWAQTHLDIFCWLALLFVIASVFIRLNYFSSLIIFWIGVNVYKINFPVSNGSDLVLLMLLVFTIPMSHYPDARTPFWQLVQRSIANAGIILCQLQIMLIYAVSGWDKLMSDSWRSGEAFQHIASIDYLFNPKLMNLAPVNPTINFWLAWMVILFELSFPFLVWFTRTRLLIIATGVVFHLVIWLFLSLPDFGLIMIISYMIFLKAEDFSWLRPGIRDRLGIGKTLS